jgi:hypothetical protein
MEGRLILAGSTDQVGTTSKFVAALGDSSAIEIKLVLFKWPNEFETRGTAYVRAVSRDLRAMTTDVEIEIIDLMHDAPLSTSWNPNDPAGNPRLWFRSSSHPGMRPEQWDFVQQISGSDFYWMATR